MQNFFFTRATMNSRAEALRGAYAAANPFPHVVIDDFLPTELVGAVREEFEASTIKWCNSDRYFETKSSCSDEDVFPPLTRQLAYAFNSAVFIEFLENLTGITALVPDPHFVGGGLHQIRRGGKLGVHVDFNYYERLKMHRRINVLLYLNEDWRSEYGGQLELWDRTMSRCERRVDPFINRCVVFSTTDESYHGHPEPLQCPDAVARKSLAFYYYTAERPADELTAAHNTVFRTRPGEQKPADPLVQRFRSAARQLLPGSVVNAVRRARAIVRDQP